MEDQDLFANPPVAPIANPEFDKRLDTEWVTLNAIREMLGISLKGTISPTYNQALNFGRAIAPSIFDSDKSLLGKEKDPPLVEEYKQRADGLSQIRGEMIEPLALLDKDIETHELLARTSGERDQIWRKLQILRNIRPYFLPRNYTENELIIRDMHLVDRNLPFASQATEKVRDYRLPDGRGLRVRLLHPDPPEHSAGADLIYEQYWESRRVVRIALVQYKIWNGRVLYFSQAANVEEQLRKLQSNFCDKDMCKLQKESSRQESYRLPYCLAFLRPTDKLQAPDSRLISSGLHVPVCVVNRNMEDTGRGNKKLESKKFRSEAVTHKVFEELFNANLLGSRWLTYEELEEIYQEHKILQPKERILLHAQEFDAE